MKRRFALSFALGLLAGLLVKGAFAAAALPPPRREFLMDFGWKFTLGDLSGAEASSFDDRAWSAVDLPHDFSIGGTWSRENPSGPAGGFAPLGVGWYRRHFRLPQPSGGKRISVEFEGIFNHADVWLNGVKVGHNEYGYLGFECDVTAAIRFNAENVLAVRADNSRQASRWYTGSGIYRHVRLRVTDPLRVASPGVTITTPTVAEERAQVRVLTTIRNDSDTPRVCTLITRILDTTGKERGAASSPVTIPARAEEAVEQFLSVPHPDRWSPESPRLYRAVSEVREGARLADRVETPFGIRSIAFDVHHGFTLNGKRVVIKGVCLHHELGALGAAAFDRAIERRLRVVKSLGCNAVRLSHNPYSPEMLDLCDRIGLLVLDEAFDKWYGFQPDGTGWKDALAAFVRRDRNHPSIVLWSVGNEMTPHMYRHDGTLIYQAMASLVHGLDPTRPVTAALHPVRTGRGERDAPLCEMAQFMDVISMNYQTRFYPRDHEQHPGQVLLGSETHVHQRSIGQQRDPADSSGNQWFGTQDYRTNRYFDYVAGQFVWAGFDYLGEARAWPSKGYRDSLVDTCGFRKPFSYYHQSLYSDVPMVRLAVDNPDYRMNPRHYGSGNWAALRSHWNWPATEKTLKVFTFTNCPVVGLLLNGRSLGERRLVDYGDRIIFWDVPNEPGLLRAVAKKDGATIASHELKTSGKAVRIEAIPDRAVISADGEDLSHVEVRAVDASGLPVPEIRSEVRFLASGPGTFAGVDNGDLDSAESFTGNRRELRDGRCLAIIRASRKPGKIRLTAHANGLADAVLVIDSRAAAGAAVLP